MDFEKLDVWKRSSELCVNVIRQFERSSNYGFRDQVCRSALSIPSNIAEGMERGFPKDKCKFLGYAKGSCAELRTQLYISSKLGYLTNEVAKAKIDETKEISAMLNGLMKRILHDAEQHQPQTRKEYSQ